MNQIHQDIRVGIECPCHQHEAVDHDPEQQDCTEENDERPASAKGRDPVGKPLPERKLFLELFADVARENFVLAQALNDFLV